MAMTPEGKIKKKIKDYLKSRDIWYYMPVSNGMGRVGCPDILVCHNGVFWAFEVKAEGKIANTTANQDREIRDIRRSGGHAFVVDNVEVVKELLNAAKIDSTGIENEGQIQQASIRTEETRRQQQSAATSVARWTCTER